MARMRAAMIKAVGCSLARFHCVQILPSTLALSLLFTWLVALPVAAQQGEPEQPSSQDQIMSLIVNEMVLAPGVGLRNIRLGENLEFVAHRLGPPFTINTKGVVRPVTSLVYQIDGGTSVVLSGRGVVERIAVRGNQTALVRTAQGARFGMLPATIQRIYRVQPKVRKNRLEYRQLGVTFRFSNAGLSQIDVYPRR